MQTDPGHLERPGHRPTTGSVDEVSRPAAADTPEQQSSLLPSEADVSPERERVRERERL